MYFALLLLPWWDLAELRKTLPGNQVGYEARANEFAYLVTDDGSARRAIAAFEGVAVRFDMLPDAEWRIDERLYPGLKHTRILPVTPRGTIHLNVFGVSEHIDPIDSVDFAGVRVDNRAVLFWTDRVPARGACSFTVNGGGALRLLLIGLAPGTWELWRNGWLEDTGLRVEPQSGALRFEGEPGSYFLRRIS